MARAWRKWWAWAVVAVALVLLGGGLWYAQARGWLAPAYQWAHYVVSGGGAGRGEQGGMGGMNMGGMNMPGMNMAGMDLGPTSMGESEPSDVPGHAVVNLPAEVQQRIGVTVGRVEEAPLRMSVRTVGIVQPNETRLARVHLKTEGWVHKLFVDYTGQDVRQGDPLLSIYSPDFLTTQNDYLNARQGGGAGAEAALRRLELWDVPPDEIRELEKTGKARTYLTLRSPLTGTVLTKNVFQGQYLTPQTELYQVADLSSVWVQAKVYEYELPHVEKGQPAAVTVQAMPGRESKGKVVFVQPTVEEPARTVQVRVELPNPDGVLKPGMFTQVVIQHHMGTGLLIPASALIRTGEQDIAYRVEAPGRFLPVEVKVSPFRYEAPRGESGGRFQVLEGLKAGEQVVTSADFLIDSESRLRLGGMGSMPGMPGMDMGGMQGTEKKGMDNKPGGMQGMEGMDHDKMKH